MVQFLSIIFFYSIFVGFFKSSRFFCVTLYNAYLSTMIIIPLLNMHKYRTMSEHRMQFWYRRTAWERNALKLDVMWFKLIQMKETWRNVVTYVCAQWDGFGNIWCVCRWLQNVWVLCRYFKRVCVASVLSENAFSIVYGLWLHFKTS